MKVVDWVLLGSAEFWSAGPGFLCVGYVHVRTFIAYVTMSAICSSTNVMLSCACHVCWYCNHIPMVMVCILVIWSETYLCFYVHDMLLWFHSCMHDYLLLKCPGMNVNLCLNVMAFLYGIYHNSVRAWLVITETDSALYCDLNFVLTLVFSCFQCMLCLCDAIHVNLLISQKKGLMRIILYLFCYSLLDIFYWFVWAQWWQKILITLLYHMIWHDCSSTQQWSRSTDFFLCFGLILYL